MSLLTGDPRSATVIAESKVSLYEVNAKALKPIFEQNDKFHTIIAKTITDRESMNANLAKVADDPVKKASRIRDLEQKIHNFIKGLFG
jgi:CRP-like cAMP-binding protein